MGRLYEHGLTRIYQSSLVWIELAYYFTKGRVVENLPEQMRNEFNLHRWQDASVRATFLQEMAANYYRLLAHYEWEEISLTPQIRAQATDLMAHYSLKPHDAVHLASAYAVGVLDLASFDEGYRRVDGLYLWNDHIHDLSSRA